ncbi:hypothetical protein BUALT_Bualt08G0105700 [Buddleja alternifolia]|uniref:WAT1-related protein n=1 Tax=Buddleja alternifolia TaxID=168488 RepID=A0AAV6X5P9_9LAMI|nr:hypothetical protein BUALT_Bualt08G0105700 [Buddleja alternifolia]
MKAIGMQKHMPLVAMITTQFVYAAMFLLSKAAISSGMKSSVFVAYRQAAATLALAPLAFFYDRKKSPPLTCYLVCKIFIVSSCGISLSLNLHYIGLRYVSATFATAITNTIPAMVFIIAICTRIEKLAIAERQGLAKVIGSILGLTGAMVYTFYKGPPIYSAAAKIEASEKTHTKEEWIKGSLLMLFANLTWAMWLIMQFIFAGLFLLSKAAISSGMKPSVFVTYRQAITTLVLAPFTFFCERKNSSPLTSYLLCKIFIVSSCGLALSLNLTYVGLKYVSATFATALITPFLQWSLSSQFVRGSGMLAAGLYVFLWGKNKEFKKELNHSKEEACLESIVTSKSPTNEQQKKVLEIPPLETTPTKGTQLS